MIGIVTVGIDLIINQNTPKSHGKQRKLSVTLSLSE